MVTKVTWKVRTTRRVDLVKRMERKRIKRLWGIEGVTFGIKAEVKKRVR